MRQKAFYFLVLAIFSGCGGALTPDTVAVVNGRKISMQEWSETVSKLSQTTPKNFSDPQARKEVLAGVVDRELLFQKALEDKVYLRSLYLKDQIVQEYLRQSIGQLPADPTDADLQKAYEEKRGEFERVDASHILFKDEATAKTVLAKIRADRSPDFAKYAKAYSQDAGSRDKGGALGLFRRRDMVPEFSQAAFALEKPGQISDLVHSQFGFHIIRLNARQGDFASLKEDLRRDWSVSRRREAVETLLTQLRASASIRLNDAAFEGK